jgi:hypothetical protein
MAENNVLGDIDIGEPRQLNRFGVDQVHVECRRQAGSIMSYEVLLSRARAQPDAEMFPSRNDDLRSNSTSMGLVKTYLVCGVVANRTRKMRKDVNRVVALPQRDQIA